jgi:hypothetical protein
MASSLGYSKIITVGLFTLRLGIGTHDMLMVSSSMLKNASSISAGKQNMADPPRKLITTRISHPIT